MRIFSILILAVLCLGAAQYDDFQSLTKKDQCNYEAWVFKQGLIFRKMGFMREFGDGPTQAFEEWEKIKKPNAQEHMFILGADGDARMRALHRAHILFGWDAADQMLAAEDRELNTFEINLMTRAAARECINRAPMQSV